jgi:uncharacterized membrane protein YphA (DoxX/SURF4 family)
MQQRLFQKIIVSILCIFTGAVFIFSAISKIPTLEQFGWTIVETTFLNWTVAEWTARLLIGFEFFLGILFIAHLRLKKIAIPFSLFILSIFTIYLLLVIKSTGNSGNCGCFGEVVAMTPLQSVYKNIVLIVLIIIIAFFQREWDFKYSIWAIAILLGITLAIPIIVNPPESIYIYEKQADITQPIPLSILYQSEKNTPPTIELRKGKHIISFMSLTCEYCRKAAKRIRIMKEKNPSLPFYVILNGDKSNLDDFFKDTRMTNVDYSMFNGAQQFALMNAGNALPSIKWVQDTTLIRESNYLTINEADIEKWLKE